MCIYAKRKARGMAQADQATEIPKAVTNEAKRLGKCGRAQQTSCIFPSSFLPFILLTAKRELAKIAIVI